MNNILTKKKKISNKLVADKPSEGKKIKNLEEKISRIKIDLPILQKEGRQLQVIKNGFLVNSYDPVYELSIEEEVLKIKGTTYTYEHNLNDFDDVVVESFELDEEGDRIYKEPFYKYEN